MSRLRDRMIEDLRLRGRADNTIDTYVRKPPIVLLCLLLRWACCDGVRILTYRR